MWDASSPVNWRAGALAAVHAWGRLTGPSYGASLLLLLPRAATFLVQASLFKEFPDPFKVRGLNAPGTQTLAL